MTTDLSVAQARRLVLVSQGLHRRADFGRGLAATHRALERLGYVQIDTISVVERAHHHTLWNRVGNYSAEHLNTLVRQSKVFEYWSHAAAYLPMRDFRFSLPRKHQFTNGERHWHPRDSKMERRVIQQIREDGPLQARDFDHPKSSKGSGWWDWKPAKRSLEQLFMMGELMVVGRRGFQKVYDLTERALPAGIDVTTPSLEQYCTHLIKQYLDAHGMGSATHIAYLRKGTLSHLRKRGREMVENNEITEVRVGDQVFWASSDFDLRLKRRLNRRAVRILSPFDNSLIQRKRTKDLFDFDYQLECYVPASKRKHGYFSLPLLWGNAFAGQMDAVVDRKKALMTVRNLSLRTSQPSEFIGSLRPALMQFQRFNQAQRVKIDQISGVEIGKAGKTVDEWRRFLENGA